MFSFYNPVQNVWDLPDNSLKDKKSGKSDEGEICALLLNQACSTEQLKDIISSQKSMPSESLVIKLEL